MLQQAYQILYFTPDLASGERLAVGAFVRDFGRSQFVSAGRALGPACLGGVRPAALLDVLLDRAAGLQAAQAAEMQRALGQNIEVGQEVVLAHRVEDAAAWVRDHVLPRAELKTHEKRQTGQRRDAAGFGFFRQRRLDNVVKRRFKPEQFWGDYRQNAVRGGLCATHWVNGGDRVLLLEPVLVRHDAVSASGIYKQILAMQRYMERTEAASTSALGAYVLMGGPVDARKDALLLMKDATDLVFDLADPVQADGLAARVRETAALCELNFAAAH